MILFFSHFTLRGKLILVIMLCCTIALLLNNLLIFSVETLDFKKTKAVRLLILADVLANNSTAALKFLDKSAATEILQSASVDHSIYHAVLLDEKCQVFAEYKHKALNSKQALETEYNCKEGANHYYTDDFLWLSIPVMLESQTIGYLYIKSSLIDWHQRLTRQLQVFSVLFLLTLLLAYLFTLKLHTYFLTPIKNLLSAIRHISEHKDYSVQVQAHTNDELALLADEFNTMIAKINRHDKLLSNQNLVLEQTVNQRTKELLQNLEQLKLAKETAEIASQAKSDFLSHMSHDLRTPLNGLLGYVQVLLRKEDFPEKYLNDINIIGQSGHYLLSMINDLLDLTKIESNKLELNLHTFKTSEFLNPIVDLFSQQAQTKQFEFRYESEGELPLALYGDENRLRRIISNLLENAYKFTQQGYIDFKVSYIDNSLVIVIEDSGCGISKSNLQNLFQPFNQFSRHHNDGVGLGLYISQCLVELMQGSLSINSQLGKGTNCLLILPLPAREYIDSSVNKPEFVKGYQGDVKTVLIVDDNLNNLAVLEAMLKPLGFNVVSVNSGLSCLGRLQTLQVDIILMDMVMPVLSGTHTCTRIHQLGLEYKPKIVMITANAFVEDREKSLAVGCDDFLAKPVLLNQLLDIFQTQLKLQWIYQQNSHTTIKEQIISWPLRILVADDSEICRLLIEHNLRETGADVEFAEQGEQALDLIRSTAFDCIILDLKMPCMTGVEIANYIHNHETKNSQSYLVLMSASKNNEIHREVLEVGFDAFLNKPIDFQQLTNIVNAAYKRSFS
ncbi:MAG: response regulator [Methylococcaceae bacterium]